MTWGLSINHVHMFAMQHGPDEKKVPDQNGSTDGGNAGGDKGK
jgi:hypothetical protein